MALVFSRVAHNHVKNGYFPTDEVTMQRILGALEPCSQATRILDPCCGEGTALANLQVHLASDGAAVTSLGVEFDAERAWHAKSMLSRCLHADAHDVVISPRSCGLLFLNPPYGLGVADQAGRQGQTDLTGSGKTERMEHQFLKLTASNLVLGGVLVLIVPHYAVDAEMATYLGRHFRSLRAFMAPEKQFKQCVIFGVRDRPRQPSQSVLAMLQALHDGEWVDQSDHELPDEQIGWAGERYTVPNVPADADHRFHAVRLDAAQLDDELRRVHTQTLWPNFDLHFSQAERSVRRPLRDMSQWHLALALAAGQVTGAVTSPSGRTLLIKGDTFKRKQRSVQTEINDKGEASQTIVLTDVFEPVIRAIDFTPGEQLGNVVTIR
jgi:hypothetical protein